MTMIKSAIGILGGTFDPIHFGHLRAAVELYEALALQSIRFIPCQIPVHKTNALANPEHRLQMLNLALKDLSFASVDERELQRSTPSYMVETLYSLKSEMAQSLCLIIGTDAFAGFTSWHQWQAILSLAHLIVVKRPGHPLPRSQETQSLLAQYQYHDYQQMLKQAAGGIYVQAIDGLTISSTQIRKQLAANKSARFLLPESVLEYISKHRLYL